MGAVYINNIKELFKHTNVTQPNLQHIHHTHNNNNKILSAIVVRPINKASNEGVMVASTFQNNPSLSWYGFSLPAI
jgi:hypothetical protein